MIKDLVSIKTKLDDNPFVAIPGIIKILRIIIVHLIEQDSKLDDSVKEYDRGFREGRKYEKKLFNDSKPYTKVI